MVLCWWEHWGETQGGNTRGKHRFEAMSVRYPRV